MPIIWTEPALRDLASALDYIGLDNPAAANRQIGLIFAAANGLLRHPGLGRAGRIPGTRELVVGRASYIVAYRLNGDRIDILRVMHAHQQWPARF